MYVNKMNNKGMCLALQSGVLLEDLFCVGSALGIQLGGKISILNSQDLNSKQSGIDGSVNCDSGHGNTGWHLYGR